ncbi:dipeptide/oligopeptide/nickel ABC transporter permease/ATP-binding protein [Fodinicola feengrottensis]|uniref:Dipeptide/oligopeptide/nickel ABC transporter permease/ATP-binding protein n=1 Tax=Fodinicola feengrottensis TaxID=435914 RepID=A0ABP4UWS4_9ACTN
MRRPLARLAAGYLVVIALASLLAPVIAPYGPDDQDLTQALSGPTPQHWLGTGVLGRDVLSRLLFGGRITLVGVLVSSLLFLAVGVPMGVLAGYFGGWIERVVLRLADLVYAVPVIIVLLVVVAIFPGNETAAMVALGLLAAPGLARIVRSVARGVREELYISAAKVSGLRAVTILRRHVLPRLTGPIVVQLSLFGAGAVLLETGLGFLGVGSAQATWGGQVSEASTNLGTQPWLLVPSGFLVISFILALGLVGDGIRDAVADRHHSGTHRPRTSTVPSSPATGKAGALLSVRGLTVAFPQYGTENTVVSGVDFDLMPAEVLGIVGESGCGKSVTVQAVLGLLRGGRITAGSVVFEGKDLTQASRRELAAVRGARIGWVSPEPVASLDPAFAVGAQVAEVVRTHRGCSRGAARRRAVELLELVRLPDPAAVARRYPHQLSGGMAQRVGIAAALAGDPVLIIADEPTTALDVTVQAEILDLLRDVGTAVILVTHDWGVLSDLCQRALVMYAGEIVEEATLTELVRTPRHPYTAGLLMSSPFLAVPGKPLPAIEGVVPAPADWPVGCRFQDRCRFAAVDCATGPVPLRPANGGLTRCLHHDRLRELDVFALNSGVSTTKPSSSRGL